MATIGVTECPICHEKITDTTLHFRTCKGAEDIPPPNSSGGKDETMITAAETARVKFMWTSLSRFTCQSVTLLSAFQQSIELYLKHEHSDSSDFVSKTVSVPIGEFDGQLVISGSYCYPVRKFLIEQDGGVVNLELDASKFESNEDLADEDTPTGRYGQYVTAYTTTPLTGTDPIMHYNPAYDEGDVPSYTNEGGVPGKRLLMIFTPTSDDAMYQQQGDIVYAKKNRQGQLQLMPGSTPGDPPIDQALGDEFSQQLSEEGFTPAPVKSKKGSTTSTMGKYSSDPSAQFTSSLGCTCNHTPSHSARTTPIAAMVTSHTSGNSRQTNGRFSVSEIKNCSSTTNNVSRDDYNLVCEERDRLQKDSQRVRLQLEGKVKRLEKKLNKYESNPETEIQSDSDGVIIELEEMKGELADSKRELELRDKELMEAKDRMTALENQIEEYAGTIDDQYKVIHNYTHHGGAGGDRQNTKWQEHCTNLTEFTKKQQIEFHLKINEIQKKMENVQEETIALREACTLMTTDINEYRTQTKQLLKDIETKRKETVILREELQKERDRRGRNPSEMDSLELETLHQKCEGWRELAERSSEEVEVLRIQVQQLEQERDSLNQELKGLVEKLQISLSDKESGQSKVSDLHRKIKELQDTRINMEEEMSKLRSEKTKVVERNAYLVDACDPNEIMKVTEKLEQVLDEKEILESDLKGIHTALDIHQRKNIDLKEQLEKTSDPLVLTQIQERLKRYKQERDNVKKQLQTVSEEMIASHGQEMEKMGLVIEELKGKKRKYREACRHYEEINEGLVLQLKEKDELIAFLQNIHYNIDEQEDGSDNVVNYLDNEVGVVTTPSPSHYSLQRGSSVQSLPVMSEQQRGSRSGIISTAKADHTHISSHTSLIDTTRTKTGTTPICHSATESPSLKTDDKIYAIQIRTNRGLQETYVQQLHYEALQQGARVIVKRQEGFERGVVKYYGCPNANNKVLIIGIQLDLSRSDSLGKVNDGTYKDNKRYFHCPKGYGVYVTLPKLFIEVNVS